MVKQLAKCTACVIIPSAAHDDVKVVANYPVKFKTAAGVGATWCLVAGQILLKQPAAAATRTSCRARRRSVRYHNDDDGQNEDLAMLERYSQSARDEALIVRAILDEQEVQVVVFKGFSSSLSYGTSADPSTSILPARAAIRWIDRIKGPFDPSQIDYIEKDLSWDAFKTRLQDLYY
ncbi:uncharacterized protein LOC124916517 [Impatiens glandulifera]|uniref:uncharacterized protein LOC124916517 n=1 Tax=Impatiens glandulifera TaxID=253017 RepID=UPI001FB072DB|nr:uncharacterized protein LOC124916517 [Impatiens glandulifera]